MNKKQQVLDAAKSLFSEKGFENTSMNDICNDANVSKGLVYHHFKSKNEILVKIFTDTTEQMHHLSTLSSHSPLDQLIALIDGFFLQLKNEALTLKLNLNVIFQPGTRTILEKQIKKRSNLLFSSVHEIFQQIDKKQSKALSFMFIAELDGIALGYLTVFEEYPLEAVKQQLLTKYQNFNQ